MNELTRLAAELGKFCSERGWRFCFIGGYAVQYWGEPRMTMDVDLSLITGFGEEEQFIDELLRQYPGRLSDTKNFALQNRVLLLRHISGVGIDIALGALSFEESVVNRSVEIEAEVDTVVRVCSAEDLIVMKAFADREIDWHDIQGIVLRQGLKKLNWQLIENELKPLCEAKEQPEIMNRLVDLRRKIASKTVG
jgi:hypothetical protein